jgi:hypothetical protein
VPGPARIDQGDLESNFAPQHVRRVFSDDGSGNPGPRLAAACLRASRRAESILLRAWPDPTSMDKLFEEDEAIIAETCRLAMAFGVEGKPEWSGQGAPYQGLEKAALAALRDLTDAETRSRAEQNGAGSNPTIRGSIQTPQEPAYVFANSLTQTRRGGY